jgi:hypothetical protein
MNHLQQQREIHNQMYGQRVRGMGEDAFTRYLVAWRLQASMARLLEVGQGQISFDSSILVLCSGEGWEGTLLCDMGFRNVTISDIANLAVAQGLNRDPRLRGVVLEAERSGLPDNAFEVVLVQDGLHHLQSPVQGFTEMLRLARTAVVFIEPHDSLVGNRIGTKWESHGTAVNYVFRWNKRLVEDVAASYLGPNAFDNHSVTYWHHTIVYKKLAHKLGGGLGRAAVRLIKFTLQGLFPQSGNNICGMVIKKHYCALESRRPIKEYFSGSRSRPGPTNGAREPNH